MVILDLMISVRIALIAASYTNKSVPYVDMTIQRLVSIITLFDPHHVIQNPALPHQPGVGWEPMEIGRWEDFFIKLIYHLCSVF
jgi:hypothetical protein